MTAFTTSDGVRLVYDDLGTGSAGAAEPPALVLLHGWGFSRRFFSGVTERLAGRHRVIVPDLRGHGDSGVNDWQQRISRLGADLHELIDQLGLQRVVVLGWSMGCAVVWSCIESFRPSWLAGTVLCSQVPRQYLAEDWPWPHAQCFDEVGLAAFQARIRYDLSTMIEEQVDEICATPVDDHDRALFRAEMAKCGPRVRSEIMADHTRQDWRDFLPSMGIPTLVMAGQHDRAYDWRGVAWIADQLPQARLELFPESAHALFHDEPAHFVQAVLDFLTSI